MSGLRKSLPWWVLAVIAGLLWTCWPEPGKRSDVSKSTQTSSPPAVANPRSPEDRETTPRPREDRLEVLGRRIEAILGKFRASSDPEESKRILDQLRETLRTAEPRAAAQAIVAFLASGADAPTKLPFSVGPEGLMEGVPSLRTALLDLLPSLDPELALEFSRSIMDQKTNPDEYALALRNLAWNDLNGDLRDEVIDRLNQMIQVENWMSKPSAGFLEAFDAAVFVSGDQSFELIASLGRRALESENQDLARASFIALDRMVQQDPSLLIQAYAENSTLSNLEANQRASLMSRLEISDAKQRSLLARYLSDPGVGEAELAYFVKVFPNGNYIHGNWLMSGAGPTRNLDERRQSDLQVLSELEAMKSQGSDDRSIQAIDQIRVRLKKQTEDSNHE